MPHKHKREKGKHDAAYYDLPPSKDTRPMNSNKSAALNAKISKPAKRKNLAIKDNDTPKAFMRLMTSHQTPRSGLDDGAPRSKKRKTAQNTNETVIPATQPHALPVPTIQPHEPLSSFNARVDAALPFSNISKKSNGGKEMDRERKTKTERKMQKMQNEWREEERRRKEKRDDEADEALVDEDGVDDMVQAAEKISRKKSGRRKKGKGGTDAVDLDDDDPWANIKAKPIVENASIGKSGGARGGGLVGLHDVVLAPPKFSKVPKVKGNLSFSTGTGGLKRQAEMTEARESVVEAYRRMIRDKRGEER